MIKAYFDGACEPKNPGGTASFGAVIFKDEKRIKEISQIFYPEKGKEKMTSNNVAEYSGFLSILEYLKDNNLHEEKIHIFGDSNLVVQQMKGNWRMIKGYYIPVAEKAKRLFTKFPNTTLHWIPREQNGIADKLSKAKLLKAGIKFKIQPLKGGDKK